jgi:cell division septation protein DedD
MARRGSAGIGYAQAFVLVFGFLITSVLIFLFGTWVGRDLAEKRLADEPVVRLAVPARPTPGGSADGVGQDFYADLKQKAYNQLKTPAEATAEAATPTSPVFTRTPTRTTAVPTRAVPTRVPPTPTRPAVVQRPTLPPAPPPTRPPSTQASTGQWTVQVGATVDSREALQLTLRLRALGFAAYTVQAPLRGQTWYRVRVGRYATRDEARAEEARLRRTGEFQGAYVTSQ